MAFGNADTWRGLGIILDSFDNNMQVSNSATHSPQLNLLLCLTQCVPQYLVSHTLTLYLSHVDIWSLTL